MPFVLFKSFHGKFIRAYPEDKRKMLPAADSTNKLAWEQMSIEHIGGGEVVIRTFHNTFLSASRDTVSCSHDTDENAKWLIVTIDPLKNIFLIRNIKSDRYLCARKGDGRLCMQPKPDLWEHWELLDGGNVYKGKLGNPIKAKPKPVFPTKPKPHSKPKPQSKPKPKEDISNEIKEVCGNGEPHSKLKAAQEISRKIFNHADKDNSGRLTILEIKEFITEGCKKGGNDKDMLDLIMKFNESDTDSDGEISKRELTKFFLTYKFQK